MEELMNENANIKYQVLIVDDELMARTLLEDYVSKIPALQLVASCANAMDARSMMQNHKIDILLTDIEMPEISGVDFVKSLPYQPSIIFTTAYSQYAISGYELGVVDYLLKPIPFSRFFAAVNKALKQIELLNKQDAQQNDNKELTSPEQRNFIMVRADRRLYKVNLDDLIYVEGQQEYVTFHTKQRNITALYSLKNLIDELPSDKFVRIHKSFIVSVAHIEIVEQSSLIVAGQELPLGPSFRDAVLAKL